MKSILVTGVAGFVGSSVASWLVKKGYNVVGIVRDLKPAREIDKGVNIAFGDVTNQKLIERVLSEYEIDTLFHFAANSIVAYAQRAPAQAISNNVLSTLSVLEASRTCGGVKSVVIQTSDKVYGPQDPPLVESMPLLADEPYSVSKAACDIIARSYFYTYGLSVVVVRPCNLYGPGDVHNRLIPNIIQACLLSGSEPVVINKGKRELLFIDDLATALALLTSNIEDCKGQAFNIGSGVAKENEEVVVEILKLFPKVELRCIEPENPIREISVQWLNSSRIRALGWASKTSFEEGIAKTVDWWRTK